MNSKFFITVHLLVFCFVINFPGVCVSEDQKALTVKKIAFTHDRVDRERITLFCDEACIPELSSVEGKNPRVVIDMKGVLRIQPEARNINTGGKLVKRIRSYLDKQTKKLRIVLDMEPSKYYRIRPMQNLSGNTYTLIIHETASLSEQKPEGNKDVENSLPSRKMHVTILRPDLRMGQKEGDLQEPASRYEKLKPAMAVKDVRSVDFGRSQLNTGEFAAAIDTFTQILADHPRDSLCYRLRGNAYDNLADRQKAMEDWTRAARLGDTTMQSYLDFLQVEWRKSTVP